MTLNIIRAILPHIYVAPELPSPKFHSVSLYDYPFPRYLQFSISPLTDMLIFYLFIFLILKFKEVQIVFVRPFNRKWIISVEAAL